jgi:hypothetical protein
MGDLKPEPVTESRFNLAPTICENTAGLSDQTIERAAAALAVSINGGDWAADYHEDQRAMWRRRVLAAMQAY